ncbi:MAG: hypothetical protein RSA44_03320 [Bacteroides sp.]
MENKKRFWTILAVVIAISFLIFWIFFTQRVENAVDQQGQEVIEGLTIE